MTSLPREGDTSRVIRLEGAKSRADVRDMKRVVLSLAVFAACAVFVSAAGASQVISTSTVTGLSLQLNSKGEALLTYNAGGKRVHVLAWGAINASPTKPGTAQVAFKLDYSGGYQKYFQANPTAQALVKQYHKIKGTPGYLTNPVIKKLRAGAAHRRQLLEDCVPRRLRQVRRAEARVGRRRLQGAGRHLLGRPGVAAQASRLRRPGSGLDDALEVHLSHWSGPLPVLTVNTDWSWHQWNHLYGTFTYDGAPVFGLASTTTGQPLDSFGRNLYLDTFDSAYGTGWKRENSFLTHKGDGVFCYSVNPHPATPPARAPSTARRSWAPASPPT